MRPNQAQHCLPTQTPGSMGANPDKHLPCSCHTDMGLPLSVLDLPVACLVQIVRKLGMASRLSLFRACKGFRDLVLDSADSTTLQLKPLELQQQQMLKALEFVHQHAKGVAVSMHGWQVHNNEERAQHARQLAERSCSLLHQAQLMGYLQSVTSLKLDGAMLAMPLMPVFSESCPNLTALTFQDSNITWEGVTADSFSATFSKLQKLCLDNVIGQAPDASCQHGLQQQIAQLTGLKSLRLRTDTAWRIELHQCTPLYTSFAAALTPTIVGQLSEFALPSCQVPFPAAWQWGFNHLKNVQKLSLDYTKLDDVLMRQLLPLPNLTSVSVQEINLEQSYSGQLCHWQQLIAHQGLKLQDLAMLPLHSNLRLQDPTGRMFFIGGWCSDALTAIQQAKQNITTSKWNGWAGAHVTLFFNVTGFGEEEVVLHVWLLLLCELGRLTLAGIHLTTSCMRALGVFAQSQQQGMVLDLYVCCYWDIADAAMLVSCLPAGSSLVVSGFQEAHVIQLQEAHVIQLCAAAQRSFALHIKKMKNVSGDASARVKAAFNHNVVVLMHETQVDDDRVDWVVIVNPCHSNGVESATVPRDSLSWALSLQAPASPS